MAGMANVKQLLKFLILHAMISYHSAKPMDTWPRPGNAGDTLIRSNLAPNPSPPDMSGLLMDSDSLLKSGQVSVSTKSRIRKKLEKHHRSYTRSHLKNKNNVWDYSVHDSVLKQPSPSPRKSLSHKHRHKHKLKDWSLENEILLNKENTVTVKSDHRSMQNEAINQDNVTRNERVGERSSSKSSLIHQPKETKVYKYSPFPDPANANHSHNVGLTITKHNSSITPWISGEDEGGLSSPTGISVTANPPAPRPRKVTIKYKPRNGPNLPLLSHFHIPNFGMVDANAYPRRPPIKGTHSVEGTFLWAVGLFGSVENGAIFLTAVFSKNFKKPLHILVGTIAGTDLFVCLIYIPTYTYFLLEGNRNLAENAYLQTEPYESLFMDESPFSFCNISRAIFVEVASVTLTIKALIALMVSVTLAIKALIALYLYILTCSRSWAKTLFSPRNTGFYIFLALLLNFVVLFLPSFVGYDKVDFYPNAFVCGAPVKPHRTVGNWSLEDISTVYSTMTLSLHLLELTIICFCFIHVHRAILKGKVYSDKYRDQDSQAKINYTRALKIMVLIFVSFLLCWLPVYIVNVIDADHTKLPTDVHHLVMDLLLLKSAINPTIYMYGMRSLRYEMKLLCMCKCRAEDRHKYIAKPPVTSSLEGATRSVDTACVAAE